MLLYLIRHGDPIYSPDSLTSLGLRQAESVAKRLALHGIDKLFSSTSNRAIMTATPTAEILKKEIIKLEWADEYFSWQEFTILNESGNRAWIFDSKKTRNLLLSKEIRDLGYEWYNHPAFAETECKNGMIRINKNADDFLESLGYFHDRQTGLYQAKEESTERIALFAHDGFSRAFLSSILDIPYPMFASHFASGHTGVTVIQFFGEKDIVPRIITFSNDSHLYQSGLPTKWCNSIYI